MAIDVTAQWLLKNRAEFHKTLPIGWYLGDKYLSNNGNDALRILIRQLTQEGKEANPPLK